MAKTIAEINEKIKAGKAVVFTAEEIIDYVKDKGIEQAAKDVDVVTTGTFGAMCSSSIYLNIGHTKPRMKLGGGRTYINDIPAYTGVAAVDLILGATAIPDDDPRNRTHPGDFNYGGGHVIEELVAGKDVRLTATSHGTDCYPRKKLDTWLNLKDVNEAVLYNLRNAYQNYNVAINLSDKTIYTYMGTLRAKGANVTYATSGQLSPLFNDPYLKTIGIGTRIFLGGGTGYVAWQGTQHSPGAARAENGIPKRGAGTLALIGDLKEMSPRWLVGTSMLGYGATLSVGVGIPIPILNEEILRYTTVTDDEIPGAVIDYSDAYPNMKPDVVAEVTYGQLRTGSVRINGKKVPAASLTSYSRSLEVAETLKDWIKKGDFLLTEAVAPLPGAESGLSAKALNERPIVNEED